jgi:hypothetical protein
MNTIFESLKNLIAWIILFLFELVKLYPGVMVLKELLKYIKMGLPNKEITIGKIYKNLIFFE